jgi:hypothetical protein
MNGEKRIELFLFRANGTTLGPTLGSALISAICEGENGQEIRVHVSVQLRSYEMRFGRKRRPTWSRNTPRGQFRSLLSPIPRQR